jgi:hypothetical protein
MTRRGRCLPKIRMFFFTVAIGVAAAFSIILWIANGAMTSPLVIVAALTACLYGAAALPHLAIGLFCPNKNCWPTLLEQSRKENGEDEEDEYVVPGLFPDYPTGMSK